MNELLRSLKHGLEHCSMEVHMKYSETGFRALYKQFCTFPVTETVRKVIGAFPGAEKANCVLTYGYIDTVAGVTMEIIAAGIEKGDRFRFFDGNDKVTIKLRIGSVENEDFSIIDDSDGNLKIRYADKIEMINDYDAPEDVEKSRGFTFLDNCRDKYCVDDVLVFLTKDGLDPEGCWVRIIGLGDHFIMGTLLNEPAQNFGYHSGEKIAFFVERTKDDKILCYSNMTPSMKLTAEDLADGSMLRNAIHIFNQERTEPHFIDVLEFLRDSYVWIPCNTILSDEDYADMERAIMETIENDGPDSLLGKTFTNKNNIRLVPDILQNGEKFFFPVFSSAEEMGEYGCHFSKIEKHFLEAIDLAVNNKQNVSGIVIDAFTEPFVLEREIFDIVQKMKTRIE